MPVPRRLVTLELLAALAAATAFDLRAPWPAVAAVAAGTVAAGLAAVPAVRRMGDRLGLTFRRVLSQTADFPQQFDVRSGDDHIGIRWNGSQATAVVRVTTTGPSVDLVSAERPYDNRYGSSSPTLPFDVIAESLHQFDIRLAAVDVISHARRLDPTSPSAAVYDRVVGPLPVATHRSTHLLLRLDAGDNTEPVARRGGGAVGAGRAVAIAARRLAERLRGSGHAATALAIADIERAEADLLDGFDLAHLTEQHRSIESGDRHLVTYAIRPESIPEALATCWRTATDSASAIVTLRPAPHPDRVTIGGLLRYTVSEVLPPTPAGVDRLDGRQREALSATIPVGTRAARSSLADQRVVAGADLRVLTAPASGSGQLLGADPSGIAVFARLFGRPVDTVSVTADIALVRQIVLRAIAIGARTVVHTDRPGDWRHLAASVADSRWLLIAAAQPARGDFDLVVLDAVAADADLSAYQPHATILTVDAPGAPPRPAAVSIVQNSRAATDFVITAAGRSIPVSMVTIPDERAWLGGPVPAMA